MCTSPGSRDNKKWKLIHDFCEGWGYHDGARYLYCGEVEYCMGASLVDLYSKCDLDLVYEDLRKVKATLPPRKHYVVKFDRIVTPRFSKDADHGRHS